MAYIKVSQSILNLIKADWIKIKKEFSNTKHYDLKL